MGSVEIISYELIKNLKSEDKLNKILNIVKLGKIVLLEGRLTVKEETDLISFSLEQVDSKFSGIEIAHLNSQKNKTIIDKMKNSIIEVLAKNRIGITVIGPAKIVKEIKMNPNKLEILYK